MTINVAVLGAGRIGRLHAGHVMHRLARFELVGLADPSPAARAAVSHDLAVPRPGTGTDEVATRRADSSGSAQPRDQPASGASATTNADSDPGASR